MLMLAALLPCAILVSSVRPRCHIIATVDPPDEAISGAVAKRIEADSLARKLGSYSSVDDFTNHNQITSLCEFGFTSLVDAHIM